MEDDELAGVEVMKTPELDKMVKVREQSQAVGEFLDWLLYEKNVTLCEMHQHSKGCENSDGEVECELREDEYIPFSFQIQELLAEYFDIDLEKVDKERRKILVGLQKVAKAEGEK